MKNKKRSKKGRKTAQKAVELPVEQKKPSARRLKKLLLGAALAGLAYATYKMLTDVCLTIF